MAPFKDDQIILISPGSETTLAQLGLPESFTPAAFRIRSRMFPSEKPGEWEATKIRRKSKAAGPPGETNGANQNGATAPDDEAVYEEDYMSEEGAVWPIIEGRIVNWSCFFALMTHVYNTLNPPFHTPILLISQPVWTSKDRENITQFFFERFKMPAFTLVDSAVATMWAYGTQSATVVDVGKGKCDITAIVEYVPHDGRTIALPKAGGDAITQRLLEVIRRKDKNFNSDMAEQLKKSPICEVLPAGTPLPGKNEVENDKVTNPAAAASTGASGSGPGQRDTAAALGTAPLGPGPDTAVGEEKNGIDDEGVLDVASIVTGGKMEEYLAKKEKEKAEKDKSKKKGAAETAAAAAASRNAKLPNSKRERATFMYEDHRLLDTLKEMNLTAQGMSEMREKLDEGPKTKNGSGIEAANGEPTSPVAPGGLGKAGSIRREIEVGTERFLAASGGILEKIADAIHRTVTSVEEVNKRSELWDSLIIVGNGTKIRGFKDALMATLQSKYIISPSSATIFTSELPSNISTPAGTGFNTPQPQLGPHGGQSQVNPLLLAATTAQNPHALQPGGSVAPSMHSQNMHSSHGQTPTNIKLAKMGEYFPAWKEVGYDEAQFLGAQIAAKVVFVTDQGLSKGYMTRSDWNESGPTGIHDFSIP